MAKSYVTLQNPETGEKITLVTRSGVVDVSEYSGYSEISSVSNEPPVNHDSISVIKQQISSDAILHLTDFDSNAGLQNDTFRVRGDVKVANA
jgi:hypothetical protein